MRVTDVRAPRANVGISRTEADCLFLKRDYLIHRPGQEFAGTKPTMSLGVVAIERNRRFVFEDGFLGPGLCTENLTLHVMRLRAIGRCGQDRSDKFLRSSDVSGRRIGHCFKHLAYQRPRQPTLRIDRERIERQCALEEPHDFNISFSGDRFIECGSPPKDVIESVRMIG
jgi:hypothetical protein